jgi:hypothetical protein
MSFLRRLLGRDGAEHEEADDGEPAASEPAMTPDEEERAHELELARFEQDRTTDLVRRQQRYGDRSWTPPDQGGPQRADGEEADEA